MGKRDVRVKSVPTPYLLALFPSFFVGIWLLASFVIAQTGWNQLREFATMETPQGQNFWMQSATIGGPRYKGALNLIVAEKGLYLRPIFPFRAFHAPLLVPWENFKSHKSQKMMWLETTQFTIRTPAQKNVQITLESKSLSASVFQKIEQDRASKPDSLG